MTPGGMSIDNSELIRMSEIRDINVPDLQEWVSRYDGHQNIDWKAWDEATAAWREQRRQELKEELARLRVQV
jgi:hypothetical protein